MKLRIGLAALALTLSLGAHAQKIAAFTEDIEKTSPSQSELALHARFDEAFRNRILLSDKYFPTSKYTHGETYENAEHHPTIQWMVLTPTGDEFGVFLTVADGFGQYTSLDGIVTIVPCRLDQMQQCADAVYTMMDFQFRDLEKQLAVK